MIIRVCAFTDAGWAIANQLKEETEDSILEFWDRQLSIDTWLNNSFSFHAPIVFIAAAGIAVRKIAPFVSDKLTDSPVIVIDENGENVIPILSGHMGGANDLAKRFAKTLDANAIITTATDIKGLFSVDVFAKRNGLKIVNREGIKKVSAKILSEGKISMAINSDIDFVIGDVPNFIEIVPYGSKADVLVDLPESEKNYDCSLLLTVKPYVLGIGCRKNTDPIELEIFIKELLENNGIDIGDIASVSSIDIKSKEYAVLYLETKYHLPFFTYSAEELNALEGEFVESDFVKTVTGVGNVCERSAIKCAGAGSKLIVPKTAFNGMTAAISERKARIDLWET